MERFPKSLALILGVLCLAFTSCVDSDNPLSDPKQSAVDPGLLGVWRARDKDGEVTYYHVGKAGDKFPAGMLRVKIIKHDKNGELERPDNDDILAFTAILGKNRYVNVTSLDADKIKTMGDAKWEPKMAEGYFIYKYEITGDKLAIACIDPEQKEAAVKAGKIKGTGEGDNRRFTDTTENLARFLASGDAEKLFFTKEHMDEGYGVLERVK
ncbi:MAG: hypothetical protein ABSA16_07815 [Thermoguttaceae bacterium]|jgi:hypothetical protein